MFIYTFNSVIHRSWTERRDSHHKKETNVLLLFYNAFQIVRLTDIFEFNIFEYNWQILPYNFIQFFLLLFVCVTSFCDSVFLKTEPSLYN